MIPTLILRRAVTTRSSRGRARAALFRPMGMALGIVVLATLLGAGGLGQEVLEALTQRRTGRGLAAGLAIVAVAMVLDRVGRSIAFADRTRPASRRYVITALVLLAAAIVVGRAMGWVPFPEIWDVSVFDPVDTVVRWGRDNLTFITRPVPIGEAASTPPVLTWVSATMSAPIDT